MFKEWIEALTILAKYTDDEECCMFSAEHDVVYINMRPARVSKPDIERLEELGFHADYDDLENFYHFV